MDASELMKQALEAQKKAMEQMQAAMGQGNINPQDLMNQMLGAVDTEAYRAQMMNAAQTLGCALDSGEPPDESELLELCNRLDESRKSVSALAESDAEEAPETDARWDAFGILLSGIVSNLNGHSLESLDVEKRNRENREEIAELLADGWGIESREELLETIEYLKKDGHRKRYAGYCAAKSAQSLYDDDMDDEDKYGADCGWFFASHYKNSEKAAALGGWDLARAAMLVRWGYFVNWIKEAEAEKILRELAATLSKQFNGWREFGNSYLFGGMFWKFCTDPDDADMYLESVSGAIGELLGQDDGSGEWKKFPWLKPVK